MAKKCPPGVICMSNLNFYFMLFLTIFVISMILNNNKSYNKKHDRSHDPKQIIVIRDEKNNKSNIFNDVFGDPYSPPLRNTNIFMNTDIDRKGIPINVPTQSFDSKYRQTGILTRINGPEMILPLMGRPLYASGDKWQYYTMSDANNSVKLPVSNTNGKNCTGEYGCGDITNGDTVYVEGYNDAFKVTVYENDTQRYIPFI